MESVEIFAMNTHILLTADGKPDDIVEGFECARDFILRREAQFTRFQDTSELSALNRAAGTWFNASPEFYGLMQEAFTLYLETNGLFNPAVLPALKRAGYDASIEIVRARTDSYRDTNDERVKQVLVQEAVAPFSEVSFHPAQHAIWMPGGMSIDLGGIAKGWIAEHAAHVLAEYTEACAVNAGGDLFTIGLSRDARCWEIEIEDPNDATQTIAILRAPPGAVATSSVTKRKWKQNAAEQHHLIDPRTGLPAITDWLSVTVLAPHAFVAEVYAKALLISGPEGVSALTVERGDMEYIAVHRDGTLWGSGRAGEFLDGTNRSN